MNIAFFASYNGSSAQAITKACLEGELIASPVLMISNNSDSPALQWAEKQGLKTFLVNGKTHLTPDDQDDAIAHKLKHERINLVVLSGYMKLIGPKTIEAVNGRILNIHPALLPHYGGQGMYGRHVHEAVKQAGDPETGITIHRVNPVYDEGDIIAQKTIPLSPNDTVDDIELKVRTAEPDFYIETLQKILNKEIAFD